MMFKRSYFKNVLPIINKDVCVSNFPFVLGQYEICCAPKLSENCGHNHIVQGDA